MSRKYYCTLTLYYIRLKVVSHFTAFVENKIINEIRKSCVGFCLLPEKLHIIFYSSVTNVTTYISLVYKKKTFFLKEKYRKKFYLKERRKRHCNSASNLPIRKTLPDLHIIILAASVHYIIKTWSEFLIIFAYFASVRGLWDLTNEWNIV